FVASIIATPLLRNEQSIASTRIGYRNQQPRTVIGNSCPRRNQCLRDGSDSKRVRLPRHCRWSSICHEMLGADSLNGGADVDHRCVEESYAFRLGVPKQ